MIVADTTPLSAFLRIGREALIQALTGELHIPGAVALELDHGQKLFGPWRERLPYVQIHQVPSSPFLTLLKRELDAGEAEAIALAIERKGELLLIDEANGRSVAQRLNLSIIGSVGLVLLAKDRGLIPAALPVLEALRTHGGLWLGDAFFQSILARIGEPVPPRS